MELLVELKCRVLILSKYSGNEYCPSWDKMLSLDKNDIMNYGYNDHWLATPEYWEFQGQFKPYSCSSPNAATPKQVTLALGGLDNHKESIINIPSKGSDPNVKMLRTLLLIFQYFGKRYIHDFRFYRLNYSPASFKTSSAFCRNSSTRFTSLSYS